MTIAVTRKPPTTRGYYWFKEAGTEWQVVHVTPDPIRYEAMIVWFTGNEVEEYPQSMGPAQWSVEPLSPPTRKKP